MGVEGCENESNTDSSSCSSRDLRLDDWITYQHDQIQRNADILKDDMDTIWNRCIAPDLPKLVKEDKRSKKVAKAILNQITGAVHKHIDLLQKLSTEMVSEFNERFPESKFENPLVQGMTKVPSISPPTSTTSDTTLGIGPDVDNNGAAESFTLDNNVNNCSVTKDESFLGFNHSSLPNGGDDGITKATAGAPSNITSSPFRSPEVLTKEVHDGQESDDSDTSRVSSDTVLISRTYTQELAKKTLSPIKVERQGPIPSPDKGEVEANSHSRSPLDDTVDTIEINNSPSLSQSKPESRDINADGVETEVGVPASKPESLLNCPKLTQCTKVVLHRFAVGTMQKLKRKRGRMKATELDELDKAMQRLLRYDPVLKSRNKVDSVKKTEIKKKNIKESTNNKSDHELLSDDDSIELSDADSVGSMVAAAAPMAIGENTSDVENSDYSDMEDLSSRSAESEGETNQTSAKEKEKSQTVKQARLNKRRYITPNIEHALFSDEENASETEKKKTTDPDGKEDSSNEKLKKSDSLVDDSNSISVSSVGEREKQKDDSSSDSDFSGYKQLLKSKKSKRSVKKVFPAMHEVDSEESDFAPVVKKKVVKSKSNVKKSGTDTESAANLLSDSSDSQDMHCDLKKKKHLNRKRTFTDSGSETSTRKTNKKKRRRIKVEKTSDATDISESEIKVLDSVGAKDESSPKGKKPIRKVMSTKDLTKSTRQAAKEEEERKKRVAENQKLYNKVFSAPAEAADVATELVLDFDKETKQPILSVDPSIVKVLKPHQVNGIKFMWENCYESVTAVQKGIGGGGCILAHCMGLGKTLQTVAFLHAVMSSEACKTKRALVICPLNTVSNWFAEFRQWCCECEVRPKLHTLYEVKGKKRFDALLDWERLGGIGIMHYESFRMLVSSNEKKKGKPTQRELRIIETSLINPGPDIVVCDEGHLLKNASSKQAKAVMKIRTPRRIVLTGTPLQNDLIEYHTMMSFVKPNLLGTKKEFRNRFENPIKAGQDKNSDDRDVKLMKRRAHVLHKLLDGCVHRLDYTVLTPYLPPKFEYAISINLSQMQKDLISYYLNHVTLRSKGVKFQASQLLNDYQRLVKIWTHPVVLTFKKHNETSSDSEGGSIKDFICDDTSENSSESEREADDGKNLTNARTRSTATSDVETSLPSPSDPWYTSILKSSDENIENIELSGKMLVLFEIIKTCAAIDDKVLVFSQFLTSLDLIENFLAVMDEEAKKKEAKEMVEFPPPPSKSEGRWRPNIEYFRIDGSTSTNDREQSCKIFNQTKASCAKLFLISTKAGGLGINLTGANRVVVFDASWNPSHDIQSIFRVYRFGQTKPCYIYRLLARGTMEEKIYNRQVVKLSLSCRVVDEQQIERHFQFDEVSDLYAFNPDDKTERPTPVVPKDRLLADLLISHKDWIFSYLEHDSLLENKQEEELTEEERKAAWEEYNNEGNPKPQQSLEERWMNHLIVNLRKKYPSASDTEILAICSKTRECMDDLRQLFASRLESPPGPRYNALTKQIETLTASLKKVYGDDTDWAAASMIQSQPQRRMPLLPNALQFQQQVQMMQRQVPPQPRQYPGGNVVLPGTYAQPQPSTSYSAQMQKSAEVRESERRIEEARLQSQQMQRSYQQHPASGIRHSRPNVIKGPRPPMSYARGPTASPSLSSRSNGDTFILPDNLPETESILPDIVELE